MKNRVKKMVWENQTGTTKFDHVEEKEGSSQKSYSFLESYSF